MPPKKDIPKKQPEHEDELDKLFNKLHNTAKKAFKKSTDLLKRQYQNEIRTLESTQKSKIQILEDAYKKQVLDLERRLESNREYIGAQDSEIADLKVALLKRAAENGFTGLPDNIIQEKFIDLMARVRGWVKDFGLREPAMRISDPLQENISQYLSSSPDPSTSRSAVKAAIRQGISSSVLLNAMVTKHLFNRMLHNPFFFLERAQGDCSSDLSGAIQALWNFGTPLDLDRANVWLSQTMSLLQPRNTEKQVESPSEKPVIEILKDMQYRKCTYDLLNGPCFKPLLLHAGLVDEARMESKLFDITRDIGEFLIKLGAQKARMGLSSFEALGSLPFRIKCGMWRPHPSMHLDEGDTACDGSDILLVVEPGIHAFGTEDGKNYLQRKVWHASTIIVSHANSVDNSRDVPQSATSSQTNLSLDKPIIISDTDEEDGPNGQTSRRRDPVDIDYKLQKGLQKAQDEHRDHNMLNHYRGSLNQDKCNKKPKSPTPQMIVRIHENGPKVHSCVGFASTIAHLENVTPQQADMTHQEVVTKFFEPTSSGDRPAESLAQDVDDPRKRKRMNDAVAAPANKRKVNETHQLVTQHSPEAQGGGQSPDAGARSADQQIMPSWSIENVLGSGLIEDDQQTREQITARRGQCKETSMTRSSSSAPNSENITHNMTSASQDNPGRPKRTAHLKANKSIADATRKERQSTPMPPIKIEDDPSYAP